MNYSAYDFHLTGINDYLESLLSSIRLRLRDKVNNGDPHVAAIEREELRARGSRMYAQEHVEDWMVWYGLVKKEVNRAKHKKFLPDGSWISNGVRFGG